MIQEYIHWNEDIGEWQLKCVAYSGNNMRKESPLPEKSKVHFISGFTTSSLSFASS